MKIAGIGFRKDAPLGSLKEVLALVEASGGPITALATVSGKADDPVVKELARQRGLAVKAVDVAGIATPTQSDRIHAMHGTGSVAEAAALVAAGPGAVITVRRVSSADGMATAAIAEVKGVKA